MTNGLRVRLLKYSTILETCVENLGPKLHSRIDVVSQLIIKLGESGIKVSNA
jgi:hypothetical protein